MLFLTDDELTKLTGWKQKGRQKRALQRMNVPFILNAVGEILVSRSTVEKILGGQVVEPEAVNEPNFEFLHGKAKRHPKQGLLAS